MFGHDLYHRQPAVADAVIVIFRRHFFPAEASNWLVILRTETIWVTPLPGAWYDEGGGTMPVVCCREQHDRLIGGGRLLFSGLRVQFPSRAKRF